MMKRSSWERKNTEPDLPGEGSSRSALSPAQIVWGYAIYIMLKHGSEKK